VNLQLLAFGLWVFGVIALAVGLFVTDSQLLRRYEEVTGRKISHSSRFARFARDPVLAVKSLPADFVGSWDARNTTSTDPSLEMFRRRWWRLFIAMVVLGFAGLPLSFATVGLFARLDRFLSLSDWMHALIVAGWLALTIAILRRGDRSRLAVAIALVGLITSVLFGLIAGVDRISSFIGSRRYTIRA
jgi:hypothetical protein